MVQFKSKKWNEQKHSFISKDLLFGLSKKTNKRIMYVYLKPRREYEIRVKIIQVYV